MTVYGLDYRPQPYAPTGALARLRPLAWNEFRMVFRNRWGIALFLFCALPSFVRLVMMLGYLGVLGFGGPMRRVGQQAPDRLREWVPTNVDFYVEQIVAPNQGMFAFLVLTALASARAVARDRETNALELYWTRGISPAGYFAAKWTGACALLATLTVGVPLVLWVLGVFLSDDWSFLADTVTLVPGALLGLAVFTAVLTALCVLLSAVVATANAATILWCMLLGGSLAVAEVLRALLHRDLGSWVSVWDAAATLARALAGNPERSASVPGALVLLGGLGLALGLLARRRLRVTEAIS